MLAITNPFSRVIQYFLLKLMVWAIFRRLVLRAIVKRGGPKDGH